MTSRETLLVRVEVRNALADIVALWAIQIYRRHPVRFDISFPVDHIAEDVDLFTARLNYKFGGPSVASY